MKCTTNKQLGKQQLFLEGEERSGGGGSGEEANVRSQRNSMHDTKEIFLSNQVLQNPRPSGLLWPEAGDSYEVHGCLRSMNPTHITWDHFDSCVHFTPFVHPIELPVQDKIPIIRHHGTLEGVIFHIYRGCRYR